MQINFNLEQDNLLVVHVSPVYPAAQEQVNEFTPSVQAPPFLHGFGEHSSISK